MVDWYAVTWRDVQGWGAGWVDKAAEPVQWFAGRSREDDNPVLDAHVPELIVLRGVPVPVVTQHISTLPKACTPATRQCALKISEEQAGDGTCHVSSENVLYSRTLDQLTLSASFLAGTGVPGDWHQSLLSCPLMCNGY